MMDTDNAALVELADDMERQVMLGLGQGPAGEAVLHFAKKVRALATTGQAQPAAYIEQYRLGGETHMELVWDDGERDDREYVPLYREPGRCRPGEDSMNAAPETSGYVSWTDASEAIKDAYDYASTGNGPTGPLLWLRDRVLWIPATTPAGPQT